MSYTNTNRSKSTTPTPDLQQASPATGRKNYVLQVLLTVKQSLDYTQRVIYRSPRSYVLFGLLLSLPFVWVPFVIAFFLPFWTAAFLAVYALAYDLTTTVNHTAVALEFTYGWNFKKPPLKSIYEVLLSATLIVDQVVQKVLQPFVFAFTFFVNTVKAIALPILRVVFGPKSYVWPIVAFYQRIFLFFWGYVVFAAKFAESISYKISPTLTGYAVSIFDKAQSHALSLLDTVRDNLPLQIK